MARTIFPDGSLPVILYPGQKLVTKTGWVFSIDSEEGRDANDMPTYRLKHPRGKDRTGGRLPAIVGDGCFSRDELQAMGVVEYKTRGGE